MSSNKNCYGIIGGMGFSSTNYLLELIRRSSFKNDQDFPELYVYYATKMPDRTEAILNVRKQRELISKLENSIYSIRDRVDFYSIVCNTIHYFMPFTKYHGDEKFISIVDMTKSYIATKNRSFVLLATKGTYISKIYPEIKSILYPQLSIREKIHNAIYLYKAGKTYQASSIINSIYDNDKYYIAGCTEISEIFNILKKQKNIICPLKLLALKILKLSRSYRSLSDNSIS